MIYFSENTNQTVYLKRDLAIFNNAAFSVSFLSEMVFSHEIFSLKYTFTDSI